MNPDQRRLTDDYNERSKEYEEFYAEHTPAFGLFQVRRDLLSDRTDAAYERLRQWWAESDPEFPADEV